MGKGEPCVAFKTLTNTRDLSFTTLTYYKGIVVPPALLTAVADIARKHCDLSKLLPSGPSGSSWSCQHGVLDLAVLFCFRG